VATSIIGQSLGKYKVVELIGHGGMASVYKGYQADIDRFVAIKVLPPHPGRDRAFNERFRMEALTIARLQHPHILPLYDYGDQDDILYLVMALVQGGALSDRIRKGKMPLAEVDRTLSQIAPALDYAHRHGVVHRDIKPDNILIDGEGYALLADFGIAKMVEGDANLTATGSLVGTPAYMSPEQAQGLSVEARSDIYSLGVVVYEMVTGRQPYMADTPMQIVMKHVSAPSPTLEEALGEAPLVLEEIMRRVLAKQPENRYPSAAMFAHDFSRAASGTLTLPDLQAEANRAGQTTMIMTDVADTEDVQATNISRRTELVTSEARKSMNPAIVWGSIGAFVVMAAIILLLASRQAGLNGTVEPTSAPTQTIVAPVNTARPVFGRVSFSTVNTLGDTINLTANNLAPLPAGEGYAVWLLNTDNDAISPAGLLRVDAVGNGVLTFTDADGQILPTLYNALQITREEAQEDTPQGDVVYSGVVPVQVTGALGQILVGSPDGIDGGSLLDGLMSEADIGRQHAGLAANADNVGGLHQHAEHTINILLGTHDDYNGDGNGQNPGRGIGIGFFLDKIDQALGEAANQPDATQSLQNQSELIRICVQNTRNRMGDIVALEREMLEAASPEDAKQQATDSTALAQQMIEGYDLNHNGQIDPFEGECGIQQIATFGVLVGNINIVAGAGEQ
jgi:serine/threonine protein kinase